MLLTVTLTKTHRRQSCVSFTTMVMRTHHKVTLYVGLHGLLFFLEISNPWLSALFGRLVAIKKNIAIYISDVCASFCMFVIISSSRRWNENSCIFLVYCTMPSLSLTILRVHSRTSNSFSKLRYHASLQDSKPSGITFDVVNLILFY